MNSPFELENQDLYQRWRDAKLKNHPTKVEDLVVTVKRPENLSESEKTAIKERIEKANMAVYVSSAHGSKEIFRAMSLQFALKSLDTNTLADGDGISSLTVAEDGVRTRYIPYTNRGIAWHTDGYYNPPNRWVHSLWLHCVQQGIEGGKNDLLDHEIAYILLRDQDPEIIRLLSLPDAMTIPANEEDGFRNQEQTGPVFYTHESGNLHMRYTARPRNVIWKEEVRPALAKLQELLEDESLPYRFTHLLQPGQGLISHNVLHTRQPFNDVPGRRRLLFRARFHDRMSFE